ncbi:hypothetical protein T4B_12300 [Trichinella pseudospiralis]|uniref:Uncharacterized protein n=1 Tax=Trichinella pseudospiralis TaxID=6337 RepID=A0A0V1GJF3_TRIPS|nr:hypothetical protein T4B_12300 [Trichinella pseudospiralis]
MVKGTPTPEMSAMYQREDSNGLLFSQLLGRFRENSAK